MKNKTYHTVETISKSNIKIVDRGKMDATNKQIHDPSLDFPGLAQAAGLLNCLFTIITPD